MERLDAVRLSAVRESQRGNPHPRLRATPMSASLRQRMEKRRAHVTDTLRRGGGHDGYASAGVFMPTE